MVQVNFDATNVAPREARDVLPKGDYNVLISASEVKENSKKTGHYLTFELTVIDGPHAGRKVYDNMNLWHPNVVAVEIAQRTLSMYAHACNVLQVGDSETLHNIPFTARFGIESAEGYDDKTKVEAAEPGTSQQAGAPTSAPGAPPGAPAAPAQQPWQQPAQQAPAAAPAAPAPAPAAPPAAAPAPAAAPPAPPAAPPGAAPAAPQGGAPAAPWAAQAAAAPAPAPGEPAPWAR